MKNAFRGFYSPTEEEISAAWKSSRTVFSFDTNTLLNLYGYAKDTRRDFFSILQNIPGELWIPYHVGLEYQRRRIGVIRNEKAVFSDIDKLLQKIETVFEDDFPHLKLGRRFPALDEKTSDLAKQVRQAIANYRRSLNYWDKKQPCVRGHDEIRDSINEFFDDAVGPPPESQSKLDALFKEGEKRYQSEVPPGYKDRAKEAEYQEVFEYSGLRYERKFGDLLIWKQLIDKASSNDIDSVVFITDDAKEDWWYIANSKGKKIIGPRAELREEIVSESKIELFAMYNMSGFLEKGMDFLEVEVSESSIDEASSAFQSEGNLGDLFGGDFYKDSSGWGSRTKYSQELLNHWLESQGSLSKSMARDVSRARDLYGSDLADKLMEYKKLQSIWDSDLRKMNPSIAEEYEVLRKALGGRPNRTRGSRGDEGSTGSENGEGPEDA